MLIVAVAELTRDSENLTKIQRFFGNVADDFTTLIFIDLQ